MTDHVDVLIVGAGLSAIGAARHIQLAHPGRTFRLIEARDTLGGTWDLFRYPGIRSDSDMHTLGFGFRPWAEAKAIADGPAILNYIRETASEYGIDDHITYGTKVISGNFSTETATWTIELEDVATGERRQQTCDFFICCSGYYRYDEGFTPRFEGRERFTGEIVHPQHWPEDLDYAGKRVVVIGSGATAVTLVPAMAGEAAHVTMLQRTPSYVLSTPDEDPIAKVLQRFLPDRFALPAVRWKNVGQQLLLYNFAQKRPERAKKLIRKLTEKQLPADFDVDKHFTPPYNPWDQRLCIVPNGDLFRALRKGKASIVTDHIETFDETGIQLRSGEHLDADIIITATGLNLLLFGGIELSVDDVKVDMPSTMTYKGLMLDGVPNYAFAIGYTNASWTLKADMTGEYVARLLSHMDSTGTRQVVPVGDPSLERRPLLDFDAGYVKRSAHTLPVQGTVTPWSLRQNYFYDRRLIKKGPIDDGNLKFAGPKAAEARKTADKAVA